jgi:hypothetical protein
MCAMSAAYRQCDGGRGLGLVCGSGWAAAPTPATPGTPLALPLQAELAKHDDKPMATGENLFSMQDARNLIRYGGMRPPDVPGHRRRPGPGRQ